MNKVTSKIAVLPLACVWPYNSNNVAANAYNHYATVRLYYSFIDGEKMNK